MRPIVLLDSDGPLSNFTKAYLAILARETGAQHTPEEVDQWKIADCDFFKQAARKINIEPKHLEARVNEAVSERNFCADIEVQPGAQEAVGKLAEIADVYVVTSPWDSSPTWMFERLHWLARNFKLPRSRVIQTGTKDLVFGDVFVDDKLSHVISWQKRWIKSEGVLFGMHHNRDEAARAGVSSSGWPEVIATVQKRAAGF